MSLRGRPYEATFTAVGCAEDVEDEISIPPTVEELIYLEMTDVERGVYMSAEGPIETTLALA